MIVAALKETYPGEARVALSPASAGTLAAKGHEVLIESGAGVAAGFSDTDYEAKGAGVVGDRGTLLESAEVLLQVRTLGTNPDAGRADLERLRPGQTVVGLGDPLGNPEAARALAERGVQLFALELLPRISRAQGMDVLSSMANVAGYKAVVLAAAQLPQMFPLQMTAAGTLPPARALIIGAGVAGLQAIATAKRLGAVVKAYDVRPAARTEVESLGATFLDLPLDAAAAEGTGGYARTMDETFYARQRELFTSVLQDTDIVVTTAAVPGAKAPVLISAEMLRGMRAGSVVVDLAAVSGGNCEVTRPDEVVDFEGVTVLGPTNLPSTVPHDASLMFSRNITTFLLNMTDKSGALVVDIEDEITRGTLVARGGEVVHPRVRERLGLAEVEPGAPSSGGG